MLPDRYRNSVKLGVLIPVFDESATLSELIARLDATPVPTDCTGTPLQREIILIDDGSTDGTTQLIQTLNDRSDVVAVFHEKNQGKGAAVRSGIRAALESKVDILIVQDGDLEYDPLDHAKVLAPIIAGRADVVIGSRFLGEAHRVLYYWHAVANRLITTLSNMLTNLNLSDIECCSKAFARPVLEKLTIQEDRFGLEPEIIARVARMRLPDTGRSGIEQGGAQESSRPVRVYEVGVSYAGRTYAEGKKITWKDGISAIRCILRYGLGR